MKKMYNLGTGLYNDGLRGVVNGGGAIDSRFLVCYYYQTQRRASFYRFQYERYERSWFLCFRETPCTHERYNISET